MTATICVQISVVSGVVPVASYNKPYIAISTQIQCLNLINNNFFLYFSFSYSESLNTSVSSFYHTHRRRKGFSPDFFFFEMAQGSFLPLDM